MFDTETFMQSTVEGESSTQYVPDPEGEYAAVIGRVQGRSTPNGNALIEVSWIIDKPGEELADQKQVRQTVWLDITESGSLDMSQGKNVPLGRLRAAVGQNAPGQMWSPNMLEGSPAMILVEHTQRGEDVYAQVKSVRSI